MLPLPYICVVSNTYLPMEKEESSSSSKVEDHMSREMCWSQRHSLECVNVRTPKYFSQACRIQNCMSAPYRICCAIVKLYLLEPKRKLEGEVITITRSCGERWFWRILIRKSYLQRSCTYNAQGLWSLDCLSVRQSNDSNGSIHHRPQNKAIDAFAFSTVCSIWQSSMKNVDLKTDGLPCND